MVQLTGLLRTILGPASGVFAIAIMATGAAAAPPTVYPAATITVAQPAAMLPTASAPLAVATAKLPSRLTTQANLNLRTGNSTRKRIILTIPKGTSVKVHARAANGWYKVTYKSRTGWASGQYLAAKKPVKSAKSKLPSIPHAHQNRGPNKTPRVVLTYDDCPRNLSSFKAVINYAGKSNIGLVIAPTGDCLVSFKRRYGVDLASLARAKGQWVINHSVNHVDLRKLSCTQGARELRGTGVRTNYGRPPYGAINSNVRCAYARADMRIWTWTRDTLDWMVRSKQTTVARAGAAKRGDTVLMHMQWQGFTPDSVRQIRNRLSDRGIGLCRAYHGKDGKGAVARTPVNLPSSLPC
ncbi:SH3 domain-containing protein [Arthrobacter sp. AQ5-05]|uniref:SH3 domain-containing protein n=1 Tax=Arthrobacter sp. AQ5-05 TaxID=2184581 RepID=UPI0015EBEA6F|nr:SH3 domain-containing protein [Arthrobacter sp. AQ5-05]